MKNNWWNKLVDEFYIDGDYDSFNELQKFSIFLHSLDIKTGNAFYDILDNMHCDAEISAVYIKGIDIDYDEDEWMERVREEEDKINEIDPV